MSLYESAQSHFLKSDGQKRQNTNKHQLIRAMHERQAAAREQEAAISERQAVQQNNSPGQKIILKNPRWIHINEENRANREFKTKFKDKILLRIDQENANGKTISFKIHDNNIPFNVDPEQLVKVIKTKAEGPIVEVEWEVSDPRSKNNKNREMDVYFLANCEDTHSVHCEIDIADILKAHIVEMEDTLFNHSSSLLLPCGVTTEDPDDNYPKSNKDQDTISGLEVIKATYEFLYYEKQNGRPKRVLLMGHSDPSGDPEYNKKLSTLRAKTILYLLLGDDKKSEWIEQFQKDKKDGIRTFKGRDIQEIVNWALSLPFPKDENTNEPPFNYTPITVDGIFKSRSEEALKGFQKGYNKAFNKDITVDGKAGKQVAEAIFDLYQWELNRIITHNFTKENKDDKSPSIDELRKLIKWGNPENSVKKAVLSCGENWPLKETNPPSSNSYRSLKDRRVELLLLDEGAESQTELCTPETCSKENCPVYSGDYINKEYLEVNPKFETYPFIFKVFNNSEPIKNASYKMTINHTGRKPVTITGKIKEEDPGVIKEEIPKNATFGKVEITLQNGIDFDIPLEFTELTPFGENEDKDKIAAEERLICLGYYKPIENNTDEQNASESKDEDTFYLALMRFKDDNDLFIDNKLNDETISKLQEKYGC